MPLLFVAAAARPFENRDPDKNYDHDSSNPPGNRITVKETFDEPTGSPARENRRERHCNGWEMYHDEPCV